MSKVLRMVCINASPEKHESMKAYVSIFTQWSISTVDSANQGLRSGGR
jgi:hypothetical protein